MVIEKSRPCRAGGAPPTRDALPVVPHAAPAPGKAERARLDALAERLRAEEPALDAAQGFGVRVRQGLAPDKPAFVFEDYHGLELYTGHGSPMTEYRALLLAGDGDMVAIAGPRIAAFETYCRETLRLGRVDIVTPWVVDAAERLPVLIGRDASAMGRIGDLARRHGGISLISYLGTADVWLLAREIAARTGETVHVASPPPRLTQRVNDKLWFADRVAEVLDRRARPPTWYAYGPAALAAEIAVLATRYQRIVVKVPASAGSLGNVAIESADVLGKAPEAIGEWLFGVLRSLTWSGEFPLLVGVWDSQVVASPSVQLWIPLLEDGPPVVEGVFQQVVEGRRGNFVGGAPADLPQAWRDRLAGEAMRLSWLMQRLGYYGRASLDAVLAGDTLAGAELHWIECNGRWGGVSVPLTLANRLVGDWRERPFVIVQREGPDVPPLTVEAALGRLGDRAWRPGKSESGIVLLTPQRMAEGSGIHFMAMATTADGARELAQDALAVLSGAR